MSIQDEEDRFSFSGVDENREEDEDTSVHGVNMRRGSRDLISSRRRNKSCVEIRDLSSSRSDRFSSLDTRTSRVSSLDTRTSRSSSQGTRSKRVSSQGLMTSRDNYQDVRTSRSGSNDARMDAERVREKTGEEKCTCTGKQNNYRKFVLASTLLCDNLRLLKKKLITRLKLEISNLKRSSQSDGVIFLYSKYYLIQHNSEFEITDMIMIIMLDTEIKWQIGF